MKRAFLSVLLVSMVIAASAQMQVWSNGTIIFSHSTSGVDSISFAGAPMQVQTNLQTAGTSASLAGKTFGCVQGITYNSSSNMLAVGNSKYNCAFYLVFTTATDGVLLKTSGDTNNNAFRLTDTPFTYTVSGTQITITESGHSYTGYVLDKGIYMPQFIEWREATYTRTTDALFLTIE